MIYIIKDAFSPKEYTKHIYSGPLIDFLQIHYPNGFGSSASLIQLNSKKLEVENYDVEILETDEVLIHINIPKGVDPFSWTAFFIYLAITVATALISYALTPRPKQRKDSRGGRVFEIGSGQNIPALGEVIAEHFGRLWFYPDVASQPYKKYINNEQYVYQILLIGAGDYSIADYKFGNTPINLIPPGIIEYQVFTPADHKSQYGVIYSEFGVFEDVISSVDVQGIDFSRNAITSWGATANAPNTMRAYEAPYGFAVGDSVMFIGQPGFPMHNNVKTITSISGGDMGFASTIQDNNDYQIVKDDIGWRGWFAVCPVGKTVDKIELDFEWPQGLFWTDSEGRLRATVVYLTVEVQQIDDIGNDVGPVIEHELVYQFATRDPIRITWPTTVSAGRYKVRCRRENNDDLVQAVNSKVYWNGLKGYAINADGQYAYGDVTLVAFKMRASEALSSSSDKISVLATRILPTIESDFAVMAPTVNPVDAFCKVVRDSDPNGLDIPELKALATRWQNTNGFNYRFADQTTVYEALQIIGYGHRAVPQAYAKLLSLRPDDARPDDQFVVTQEQMLADSYRTTINLGQANGTIDGYRVEYQDPTSITKLYIVYPSAISSPQDIDLIGCTDQLTAIAHGQYLMAKKTSIRRTVQFDTEYDSLAYSVGDRILVVNNIIDDIRTCRVLSVSGNELMVDGSLSDSDVIVVLRDQYGSPSDKIPAFISGNKITLSILPAFPIFGLYSGQESTTVAIGTTVSFNRSYTVSEISPDGAVVQVSAASYTSLPYLYPIPGEVIP